jgi:hypothetical protein
MRKEGGQRSWGEEKNKIKRNNKAQERRNHGMEKAGVRKSWRQWDSRKSNAVNIHQARIQNRKGNMECKGRKKVSYLNRNRGLDVE